MNRAFKIGDLVVFRNLSGSDTNYCAEIKSISKFGSNVNEISNHVITLISLSDGQRCFSNEIIEIFEPQEIGSKEKALNAVKRAPSVISYLDSPFNQDLEIVKEALNQNGLLLEFIPEFLKCNEQIVQTAIEQNGMALQYAADELRTSSETVLKAIRGSSDSFQFASHKLRGNREFVLRALRINPGIFEHVSFGLINDREIVQEAVTRDGSQLAWASTELRNDPELITLAGRDKTSQIEDAILLVKQKGIASLSEFEPDLLERTLLANFDFVKAVFLEKAIRGDGHLMSSEEIMSRVSESIRNDKKLLLDVLSSDICADVLEHASDETLADEAFMLTAIDKNCDAFCYSNPALLENQNFLLKALAVDTDISSEWNFPKQFFRDNRSILLELIQCRPRLIGRLGIQVDHEIATTAIRSAGGEVLEFIPDEIKDDEHFLLEAIKVKPLMVDIPKKFLDEKGFMMAALAHAEGKGPFFFLRMASKRLKEDREFVLAAVSKFGRNECDDLPEKFNSDQQIGLICAQNGRFDVLSSQLLNNLDFMNRAAKLHVGALYYASQQLKDTFEYVKTAVEYGGSLTYASEALQKNPELRKLAGWDE